MKSTVIAAAVLLAAFGASAQQQYQYQPRYQPVQQQQYQEQQQQPGQVHVINVRPNLVTVMQQQCRQVYVQNQQQQTPSASGILGALAGAAIGNQVGGGSGRDIATAAGAVIGYGLGNQPGNSSGGGVEQRTVCENVPTTVQRGEIVTFQYKGRQFTQTIE